MVITEKENIDFKTILVLLLGILFFVSVSAKSNERATQYSMHMLGANIGEFTVTQTSKNGTVSIKAITDVEVNLLFSYRIKYVQNTAYMQGVLQSSHVETYKNGKLNSNVWLKREKDFYLLINDGDTTIVHDTITYSGSLIYFNEPKAAKRIFKERNAEMREIIRVSEHSYILKDEKNREINRYYYEDGILQYAKMKHVLGNLELKRVMINK